MEKCAVRSENEIVLESVFKYQNICTSTHIRVLTIINICLQYINIQKKEKSRKKRTKWNCVLALAVYGYMVLLTMKRKLVWYGMME